MTSLSIAIVTYHTDPDVVLAQSSSIAAAIEFCRHQGIELRCQIFRIDNSGDQALEKLIMDGERSLQQSPGVGIHYRALARNIGYGPAHNLALEGLGSTYHLIINPDVLLEKDVLWAAVSYMEKNPDVAVVTPQGTDDHGHRLFLQKRYPSLLDLLLRGFAPSWLKRFFAARLDRYEMRDQPGDAENRDVLIASGCFMFCRTRCLRLVNGFNPDYFLYFEDFDLSLRIRDCGRIAFLPGVHIRHSGGNAARKGIRHIWLFVRGAIRFFRHHGWKLF